MKRVWCNGSVILPDGILENGAVLSEDGRISAVGSREAFTIPDDADVIEAQGGFISPGYVDIHVHGGAGADFMDGTPEAVSTASRAHARHGTTSIFPTTTTGSIEQIEAMLRSVAAVRDDQAAGHGPRIAGVHFYGPYFAADKVGCHSLEGQRAPDPAEYSRHFETGLIKVATCAAELPGAIGFYREASRRGCLVTCGHSNASWAEMAAAFDAGMRHVDHFWCAMSSTCTIRERLGRPFQASMAEFVLMQKAMSTEVIADGCHLAPELLNFAYVMKGIHRLCLVTDANRALDMPPGRYRFGPGSDGAWFESDGNVGIMPTGSLASSVVGMDTMVRNMWRQTQASEWEAVRMGSLTPAERVGMASDIGSLEAGKQADVLVLGRELEVQQVFIGGQLLRL